MDRDQLSESLQILMNSKGKAKEKKLPSIEAQKETLQEYLNQSINFKIGDFVTRNRFGEMALSCPNSEQIGLITEVFPCVQLDKSGMRVHGIVAINHTSHIQSYGMDFRLLEKVA